MPCQLIILFCSVFCRCFFAPFFVRVLSSIANYVDYQKPFRVMRCVQSPRYKVQWFLLQPSVRLSRTINHKFCLIHQIHKSSDEPLHIFNICHFPPFSLHKRALFSSIPFWFYFVPVRKLSMSLRDLSRRKGRKKCIKLNGRSSGILKD